MQIQRFDITERSSQAVVAGGFVFLAGQIARDSVDADIATQTRETLARIDALLARAGTDNTRLVNATIWLADIRDFQGMNEVWSAWVPPGTAPARAVLEGRMAYPGFKVEIAVTALARG
jgi:enamine deaminase RidA (YjgF/YER057c/UK114 family)